MPVGGIYAETLPVFGSTLARLPREMWALNQIVPFSSRMRPCDTAALPFGASMRSGVICPVLASILPTDMVLLGTTAANQRLPSLSAAASCGSEPTRDGVPMVQSLPSLG